MWVMASFSSVSVLPFCLARPRWYVSCSLAPSAASTETVTRLRSLGDSPVRGHTWPNSTSSVKCTKSGANSPNAFCAPDGSFSSLMVAPLVELGFRIRQEQGEHGGKGEHAGGDEQAGMHAAHERVRVGEQPAEHGDREGAADLAAGVEHPGGHARLMLGHGVEQHGGRRRGHGRTAEA